MSYIEPIIEFKNFNPDYQLKRNVNLSVRRIEWLSPSDASLYFILWKSKGRYKAHCKVSSISGLFTSSVESDQLSGILQQVENDLVQQLNQWKQNRFFDYAEAI